MNALQLVCSILDDLNPIELTPLDKLDDMLEKSKTLSLLINKFDLVIS